MANHALYQASSINDYEILLIGILFVHGFDIKTYQKELQVLVRYNCSESDFKKSMQSIIDGCSLKVKEIATETIDADQKIAELENQIKEITTQFNYCKEELRITRLSKNVFCKRPIEKEEIISMRERIQSVLK